MACAEGHQPTVTPPPLKVVMVITGLGTGGAEAMLEKLIGALSPAFAPQVVSLTNLGEVGPRLQQRGVVVTALAMRPGRPSLAALWRLTQLLRRLRPDVVHTWMYHADLLGGIAARLAGVPAVLWGVRHSNLDPALNKRSTLRVMRACALLSRRVPTRITCAATRARDAHVAAGYAAERMVVIPNGFDLDRFRPDACAREEVRAELGLPAAAPLVGMVGRFDAQKNHAGFAQAAAFLLQQQPDVRFLLAGSGVDVDNAVLMGWLKAAGVAAACVLLGRREDVPRLMAALDVLVLPSLGEAFPNVLGEAMACGVPCVACDVGDCAEIVTDAGRVVPAGDMRALAVAAAELLALAPAERAALSRAAQADVRRRFEIGTVAARYQDLYLQMTHR